MKHDLHDFASPDALILKESLWGHSLSSYMHVWRCKGKCVFWHQFLAEYWCYFWLVFPSWRDQIYDSEFLIWNPFWDGFYWPQTAGTTEEFSSEASIRQASLLEGLLKQANFKKKTILIFLSFIFISSSSVLFFSHSSSSLTATHPSSPSTPSGPSTRTATAPSTSESSSVRCPSHHEAASSRNSTGPSICTTWTGTARSHGWRCWRSSRYLRQRIFPKTNYFFKVPLLCKVATFDKQWYISRPLCAF